MRLTETTRAYFEKLAAISPPERAAIYKAVLDPTTAADAQKMLREQSPGEYSMLRTSIVPTMLKLGTEMYQALTRASAAIYPAATVIPSMSTGASDIPGPQSIPE